jgi:hypothetical protein
MVQIHMELYQQQAAHYVCIIRRIMATRKKATSNGLNGHSEIIPQPSPEEVGYTEQLDSKLTYNCRTDTESLTIRTNSEAELEELIGRWKYRIIQKAKPKMNDGDKCLECEGFLTIQTGTNRATGKVYNYLGCSNFPKCTFTCYIAQTAQAQTA